MHYFILFFLFTLSLKSLSQKLSGRYELHELVQDEVVIYSWNNFDNTYSTYLETKATEQNISLTKQDSINYKKEVAQLLTLFDNMSIWFMSDNQLLWNTIDGKGSDFFNHLKLCGISYLEDKLIFTVPGKENYAATEYYEYKTDSDTLWLIPTVQGQHGWAKYVKIPADKTEFNQAWNDLEKPIIIDAYGPNPIDWDKIALDKRLKGIIHKCSQGLVKDEGYQSREQKAKSNNYLWGAYHLGTNDDPVAQADFFLSQITDIDNTLIALDLEETANPKFMNLENAEKFIQHIKLTTGRYPVLYCNNNVLKEINSKYGTNSVFAKCPLWYARFRKDIPNFEQSTWETYTLWQFSSEINCSKTGKCLYNIPGCEFDMDINVFNGSIQELEILWPIHLK